MKKISLIAIVGAVFACGAHADTAEMRETMVTVDQINGDLPAPQNTDQVDFIATTTTTTTTSGPTAPVVTGTAVTVKEAKSMPDETYLVLRGNIIKSLGDEKYVFQDDTDTITVEIDDDDWNGLVVSPTDMVTIWGELDSGMFKTEIDVDRVQIM